MYLGDKSKTCNRSFSLDNWTKKHIFDANVIVNQQMSVLKKRRKKKRHYR